MKEYLEITPEQQVRLKRVEEKYKQLYNDPDHCDPLFIIHTPVDLPPMEERLADPAVMLKGEFDSIRPHLEIEDDYLPTVRVQFGTPQVASAFGCEIYYPEDSLPAAKNHPLTDLKDAHNLSKPSLTAGIYEKVKAFTEYFKENIPEGVAIQHPDIQSPFNTAHLVRGDSMFTDFYDDPDGVEALLDRITDYMIDLVPYLKSMVSEDKEWFHDWGGLWKGQARISNCSMQMISPEFYCKHVLPRDLRLMKAIGGGRMHYCGRTGEVIKAFFKNPDIHALDYDSRWHDLWEVCEAAPDRVVIYTEANLETEAGRRLLSGDWPKKRNLLITVKAGSIEQGKSALSDLRASINRA
jgi:hypothetical protein